MSEVDDLRWRVRELEAELAAIRARNRALASSVQGVTTWLTKRLFGSRLVDRGHKFAHELGNWQAGSRTHAPLAEAVELAVAVLARFIRVGIVAAVLALIPAGLLVVQTWLLANQNTKLEYQNSLIAKDIALSAFEQTTRFRELLAAPPRAHITKGEQAGEVFLNPYKEGEKGNWPPPSQAAVIQIAMLSESHPALVINSLSPLVSDDEGTVAAGAVLALRETLVRNAHRRDELLPLLPDGHLRPVQLDKVYIHDEDLTTFVGTTVLAGANFRGAMLENVIADRLFLRGAVFREATVIQASFRGSNLEMTYWDRAVVRDADFSEAAMAHAFAEEADFGILLSSPGTVSSPCRFERAILNDVLFNRATLVAARLHGASMRSMQVSAADLREARMDPGDVLVNEALLGNAGVLFADSARVGRR